MTRPAFALAVLGLWPAAGCVLAMEPVNFSSGETRNTLIELFTSEGCSSCPPAEKWLSRLKSNPDLWRKVVPVAFHVDYWDHLGWRDRFAKAEYTQRQRHYAAAWRGESIYTPGFAANGMEWQGWLNGAAVPMPSEKVGSLQITSNDGRRFDATFTSDSSAHPTLEIALLGNDLVSDVKRGENSGRELRHDFVALQIGRAEMTSEAGRWSGAVTFARGAGPDRPGAIAAWVTLPDQGPIQATGGWLPK